MSMLDSSHSGVDVFNQQLQHLLSVTKVIGSVLFGSYKGLSVCWISVKRSRGVVDISNRILYDTIR